jgi:hypothetical protein
LIKKYQEIKGDEFIEDAKEIKGMKENIKFYSVNDVFKMCVLEDKSKFRNYFRTKNDDIIMFVRAGSGNNNICTLDGRLNLDEKFLFIIRKEDGQNKIITDYTE